MAFPPELFIIGAQRSGTTSLSALLDQHPAVVLSTPKETDFFSVNFEQGLGWYRARFRRLDALLVDASVSYTMASPVPASNELPDVMPRLIHKVSPGARFIYLVRDPAERCHSAYWHDVRAGREGRSLRAAVEQSVYYSMASYYYRQLTPFLYYFPLDRFLILRFEDFAKQPLGIARECMRFAGLDDSSIRIKPEERNRAFLYNSFGQKLRRTLGEERLKLVSRVAANTLPTALHPLAKALVSRAVPALSSDDRAWLDRHFADDAASFAQLTGINVTAQPAAA